MHTLARSVLIGGAVMVVIATSFALGRGPVPTHTFRDKPFNDALHEDIGTLAITSERIDAMNKPRVVHVVPIKPEPDPLMMVLSEPSPLPKRKAVAATDICAKHNMRRVYYGSTWRCRK